MVSLTDSQTLAVLRRASLDIFWSRDNSTIHGMLGYTKELVSRAREPGRELPLPAITAWTVGDKVGIGVAIHMLEESSSNGRNGRNYLQFNMVSQLRAAVLDIY